jgi:hypothetical protein
MPARCGGLIFTEYYFTNVTTIADIWEYVFVTFRALVAALSWQSWQWWTHAVRALVGGLRRWCTGIAWKDVDHEAGKGKGWELWGISWRTETNVRKFQL